MKKKYLLIPIILILFAILWGNTKVQAKDLDEIINYVVTVDPRMNDGSLDITYEITWKVLDDDTEGPLSWVQIGTPNEYFDTPTALTSNISKISAYNGSFVRIDFGKKYYAGDQVTFKYRIHQSYMYKISWGKCVYSFTPAWFTDAKVDNLTIRWNKDQVKSNNSNSTIDNYLVWTKRNMSKGEKLTIEVKYEKSAFGYLSEYKQQKNGQSSFISVYNTVMIIIFIAIIILSISRPFTGGYYGHRGFYGGYHGHYWGGGCVHSSCAHSSCAHSSCAHSCACACAGSGRAGCSKKDFYGTKINKTKWDNVMSDGEKNEKKETH